MEFVRLATSMDIAPMPQDMNFKALFTEYDDSIAGDINLDPLGLLTIWSGYGQKIFRNRISSISNDVRSYTLNLFHHHLIRSLVRDDSIILSAALAKAYPGGKESLSFKQACLIHLENLFIFAHLQNERMGMKWAPQAIVGGLLGVSKARRRIGTGDDVTLQFSASKEAQLLVRQLLLGVSGRYKTPMMEMGFFDRLYNDGGERATAMWGTAGQFINGQEQLRGLAKSLLAHFRRLLASDQKVPALELSEVDIKLKKGYVQAFASAEVVGSYARDYWLRVTELDRGAAGAILNVVDGDIGQGRKIVASSVFSRALALRRQDDAAADRLQLEHVLAIEPFLTNLDLLFGLVLSKQSHDLDDVVAAWGRYGRSATTLPEQAAAIKADTALCGVLVGLGRKRLARLVSLANCAGLAEQMALLLAYHKDVMSSRGQTPWLALEADSGIKVFVRRPAQPAVEQRTAAYWSNQYYIPQFANLVRGFRGVQA
jgi:hypothetical protein